jgi:hypothetical protein
MRTGRAEEENTAARQGVRERNLWKTLSARKHPAINRPLQIPRFLRGKVPGDGATVMNVNA